jgi:hypothetical protein
MHLTHIYRKLATTRRGEAIRRGGQLELMSSHWSRPAHTSGSHAASAVRYSPRRPACTAIDSRPRGPSGIALRPRSCDSPRATGCADARRPDRDRDPALPEDGQAETAEEALQIADGIDNMTPWYVGIDTPTAGSGKDTHISTASGQSDTPGEDGDDDAIRRRDRTAKRTMP